MAKKVLHLSEIKVKSMVTQIDKCEQRTAKGGYVYNRTAEALIISINPRPSWTEYKTRVSEDSDSVKLHNGNER